ncbi:procathepsin L-like [Mobula hypostoma]|uniref:procathepsin L-like n=1 Tax=Mobula hypostoma TaxID=723540 RepID=UPI002FC311CE
MMDKHKLELVQLFSNLRLYKLANYTNEVLFDVGQEEQDEVKEVDALPSKVDWRSKKWVTTVKGHVPLPFHKVCSIKLRRKGRCNSCYAFSTVGALEGQLAKIKQQHMELSEQSITDCSANNKNYGCRGCLSYHAFECIRDHGIQTHKSYPYKAKKNNKCLFKSNKSVIRIKKFRRFMNNKDKKLVQMVADVGPISVLVHCSHSSWRFYKSGIYDNVNCDKKHIDHFVLLVGYVDQNPKSFWIVKNSWGTSWGENGYLRIIKGNSMCEINFCAAYPEI